jgi:hypothetical protein
VVIGAGSVYPRKNRKQILVENACQKITILNLFCSIKLKTGQKKGAFAHQS